MHVSTNHSKLSQHFLNAWVKNTWRSFHCPPKNIVWCTVTKKYLKIVFGVTVSWLRGYCTCERDLDIERSREGDSSQRPVSTFVGANLNTTFSTRVSVLSFGDIERRYSSSTRASRGASHITNAHCWAAAILITSLVTATSTANESTFFEQKGWNLKSSTPS